MKTIMGIIGLCISTSVMAGQFKVYGSENTSISPVYIEKIVMLNPNTIDADIKHLIESRCRARNYVLGAVNFTLEYTRTKMSSIEPKDAFVMTYQCI